MASPNPIPPNPTTPTTYILPVAFTSLHEPGISSLSDKRVPQIDPQLLVPGAFLSPNNEPVGAHKKRAFAGWVVMVWRRVISYGVRNLAQVYGYGLLDSNFPVGFMLPPCYT